MATPRQERKVVTVLFADLVGFTSRVETMDPEDVAGLLGPYHARLRSELERFGGTVEKFIGDAVMAVFGAPIAHEDDPERAVRAALAIRDWVLEEGGELEVRIAVNTGEALVSLDARPEQGESMVAGDVVNTAARLQSAAPVNGILVGETAYRATRDAIDYREAQFVEAKGKAEPVPVWEALQARSSFGVDVIQEGRAPLMGRQRELDVLLGALERVRTEQEPQLVTLVGVPGIGKSRLVWELLTKVEEDPELVYWRQGRCLPYGEGVTFWAVGEMVKAQAGILDTDSGEEARAKLEQAAVVATGDDAPWVLGHLRPLIGLAEDTESGEERRTEAFAAWRRFFEGLAEQRPLVLVFEDLQWADDGLLDFVDHLIDWATGACLLAVCTARPELLERRPGWGGGKLNATTLALPPLSREDAARLVSELTGQTLLPAETQAALLARAGGNPLYAEQYARMFLERGDAEDLPLPETVQGIIAARLDALPPDEKAALQDAAVIGKVFWPGAIAAVGGSDSVEQLLHPLERKEFVRRERRSTVGGETEYAFRHVLVRDVGYGQIPRAQRAEKHRRAAEWIESLSERTDDVAEMLAYHYSSALEFARASGQDTTELGERARHALRSAGERALALGAFPAAARFLSAALDLWPAGDAELPALQLALTRALYWLNESREELLAEARDGALALGRTDLAAEAEVRLGFVWWNRGRADRTLEHMQRARELISDAPPSPTKADVLHWLGVHLLVQGAPEQSLAHSQEARALAERFGNAALRAQALITTGSARFSLGDVDGLADLEQGLAAGEELNSAEIAIRGCKNLGDAVQRYGDLSRTQELHARGLETARRFGDLHHVRWFTAEQAYNDYFAGRWPESLAAVDAFLAETEAGSPHYMESLCREARALIRLARGDGDGTLADVGRLLELGRSIGDPQVLLPAIGTAARVLLEVGRRVEAGALVGEAHALLESREVPGPGVANMAFVAAALGRELPSLATARLRTPWIEAADATCRGDFIRAAEVYGEMRALPYEADARLRAARALVEEGLRFEANDQLQRALAFYRSVGATAYVREGERLLAATA